MPRRSKYHVWQKKGPGTSVPPLEQQLLPNEWLWKLWTLCPEHATQVTLPSKRHTICTQISLRVHVEAPCPHTCCGTAMLAMVRTCYTDRCNASTVTELHLRGLHRKGAGTSLEVRLGDEHETNAVGPGNGWNDHRCNSQRNTDAHGARACTGLAEKRHRTWCGYGMYMHGLPVLPLATPCYVRKCPVALQASSRAKSRQQPLHYGSA